ncbi:helix-turn-helix transcriptional regulator [Streptomyces varsoviensis]|uniref:helix-turn-helix transcriptional regulator n=1 Tax=Streptomyces varsoviensis TaxID=67373 RepID=UPI0034017429
MSGNIGPNIRRLRLARGWSQSDLARRVCRAAGLQTAPVGRQEISRYEVGKRVPREWLPVIATVLGVTVQDLTAEYQPPDLPLPSLDDYLPAGDPLASLRGRRGQRIGAERVDNLRQRVHGLRLADDVLAGGDLIRPALRELRSAIRLYREKSHTADVGIALLSQIGEVAQIAGWIASDAGQHDEAERIYRLGFGAAQQAGDTTLAGNLAGSLAYQMTNTGREAEGSRLARAALKEAGTDAPAKARALYLDRVAWAYSKTGDAQPAIRALGEAGEALTRADGEPEAPAYLYWVDEGELQIMESRVYTELRRPLRAIPLLRDVLSRYDATHQRELTLYLSWLAIALADANEPEEAASVMERVLTLSTQVSSERTASRVQVVLNRLEEYRDVPQVRAVLDAA